MILKGSIDETRRAGLPALRAELHSSSPLSRTESICLRTGTRSSCSLSGHLAGALVSAGALCIGDAAHAMSPLLGVGLGLAVQDAVAAANILWQPLTTGPLREADLARVQKRREFPTRLTQGIQIHLHRSISRALQMAGGQALEAPMSVRLLAALPMLRRLPARLVGMGVRPEHVRSPQLHALAAQ